MMIVSVLITLAIGCVVGVFLGLLITNIARESFLKQVADNIKTCIRQREEAEDFAESLRSNLGRSWTENEAILTASIYPDRRSGYRCRLGPHEGLCDSREDAESAVRQWAAKGAMQVAGEKGAVQ